MPKDPNAKLQIVRLEKNLNKKFTRMDISATDGNIAKLGLIDSRGTIFFKCHTNF